MVVLPAIGAALAIRTWLRGRHGMHASARVVGHVRDEVPGPLDGEYSSRELPVVEFEDDLGKRRRITLREEIGDTEKSVRVVFPRGRPKEARVDKATYRYIVPAVLITPGLALAIIYAGMSLYAKFAV